MRVELVDEPRFGFGNQAAGRVQAAARDVVERIAKTLATTSRQAGNFGVVPVAAQQDEAMRLGVAKEL